MHCGGVYEERLLVAVLCLKKKKQTPRSSLRIRKRERETEEGENLGLTHILEGMFGYVMKTGMFRLSGL